MAFQSKLKTMQPRRVQFQKKVKLLSGGYVKPDSFPGGEITVFPWDSSIDDWLSERGKKGDMGGMLYELCAQVCDLNGCPIDLFVLGDVNTVLLVSRSIRFNGVVEYEAMCPNCGHESRDEIKVPDELGRVGEKGVDFPGWDEITLPDVQDVVKIRPLQVKDEKAISTREPNLKQLMTDHIMTILTPILSINDGRPDAWEQVLAWYNALSPKDAAYLEAAEDELFPHLDTNIPHRCDRCGHPFKHPLNFNAEFFRSSLKRGQAQKVAADVRPGVGDGGKTVPKPDGGPGHDSGADDRVVK